MNAYKHGARSAKLRSRYVMFFEIEATLAENASSVPRSIIEQ